MKITFEIYYHTWWGESVLLVGDIEALGANDEGRAVVMNYQGDGLWRYSIEVPNTVTVFNYRYLVKQGDNFRKEWGAPHCFSSGESVEEYRLQDRWREQPAEMSFYSSAFTEGIFSRRHTYPDSGVLAPGAIRFKVYAPQMSPDELLVMVGNCPALGNWDVSKAPQLSDTAFPEWQLTFEAGELTFPLEYKFVVVRTQQREVVAWESGENRRFVDPIAEDEAVIVAGLCFNGHETRWRGAGTAIPVFSLRTEQGFGIGEFFDLKYLVDWALRTGQSFIQLLPINDTTMSGTWQDSYPYNANSTFALHPQYLRLSEMGTLSDAAEQARFDTLRAELNRLPEVDYERVNRAKREYLQRLFDEQGEATLSSNGFKDFFRENKFWLLPYAAYCSLRDRFGTADFTCWEEYSVYDEHTIADYCAVWSPWYKSVAFYYYVQYHLHIQLSEVKAYAHRAGVVLKGDIPIGISRDSVDAWVNPHLFHMNGQAGAPPDDFSVEGQNWGFPTYNWAVMARDGYAWWKARLRKMADYFDAYRIDHILGFFRIWEIPLDAVHGLLGYFNPAMPLSPDEMATSYGFLFDASWQTTPYIREEFLSEVFGPYTDEVKARFLLEKGDGKWAMNVMWDTQRKIVDYFYGADDEMNVAIKEGLLKLVDEVLFIEDPGKPGYYHPRISGQRTQAYRALDGEQKGCFDRLYEDFFYWRHNDFWKDEALRKLPALIASTDMLVCGEDLGMIPGCVPNVMDRLQILSLEIQRMPKAFNCEFADVTHYPYRSVCTTSTHDMSGIRGWWEEDPARTQRFFNEVLGEEGKAPRTCEPWICRRIIELNLSAPSMLAILPLQDWLSIDGRLRRENPQEERINIPASSRHYWRYRMHITIEQLLEEGVFNTRLRELIESSGR